MKRRLRHWKRVRCYGDAIYGKNYPNTARSTVPMCVYKCLKCGHESYHTGRDRTHYCYACYHTNHGVRMKFDRYQAQPEELKYG